MYSFFVFANRLALLLKYLYAVYIAVIEDRVCDKSGSKEQDKSIPGIAIQHSIIPNFIPLLHTLGIE
jgi:hypothetical protein